MIFWFVKLHESSVPLRRSPSGHRILQHRKWGKPRQKMETSQKNKNQERKKEGLQGALHRGRNSEKEKNKPWTPKVALRSSGVLLVIHARRKKFHDSCDHLYITVNDLTVVRSVGRTACFSDRRVVGQQDRRVCEAVARMVDSDTHTRRTWLSRQHHYLHR